MQAHTHNSRFLTLCTVIALGLPITPVTWADATLDGSMGSTGSFSGNFTIPDTVGQTRGSNLFHSFSNFSINAGESATFTGPDAINNVVSRVTGNSPSTFNGPLTSAIPSANFYFLNPNGVLFKEGAQISVDGSFYATTSDFVRLGQDGIFYADPAAQSVLTSSPPSSFGFLDGNPGQISLTGTQLVKFFTLNQPDGATLSLVGGDITLEQAPPGSDTQLGTPNSTGSFISATGNSVEMVSVASAGEAVPGSNNSYDLSSFDTLGNIEISGGSVVDATNVYIRGGKLTVNDSVVATGFFFVAGMGPPPDGGNIEVSASEEVNFTGTAPLQIEVDPGSGPITPTQPDGGPYYSGVTAFGGSPVPGPPPSDAPDINITGGDINMSGFSGVINQRFGPGNAGDINIKGETVAIKNGAVVGNVNFYAGSGDSVGNITVDADQVILDGEGDPSGFTGLNSSSFFSPVFGIVDIPAPFDPFNPDLTYGDSGNITVNATGPGGLTIRGGASIIAESRNFGQAGNIIVNASNLFLTTDGMPFGAIASQSAFAGNSGDIQVNASGDIQIQEGFEITGSTAGTGTGGNVSVTAGNAIDISGENSGIASATVEPPPQVEDLLAQQFGLATFDELVAVLMDFELVDPDADLFDAMAALQTMGLIDLGDPDPTAGNAGPVTVNAASLSMSGSSRITSSTTADGEGGPVNIQTGSLILSDGAEIRSRSGLVSPATGELDVGSGNGGILNIDVAGTATITGRGADGSPSSISTSSQGDGNGGSLSLTANIVNLNDGGTISASSSGNGLAGDISINAGERFDLSGGRVTTQATVSDGGNIDITATERVYLDKAEITTSVESGLGGGGNINIDPKFVILNQSNILANAFGGPGGNINIVAGNLIVTPDSVIDASSALGLDGTVNISSPDEEVADDLAVLPDNYLDVTSLMSERCGTTAGASSLVDAGPGGLAVDPDGYLPSFATATNQEDETKGANQASLSGKRWWTLHADPALQLAQVTCTQ